MNNAKRVEQRDDKFIEFSLLMFANYCSILSIQANVLTIGWSVEFERVQKSNNNNNTEIN